MACEWQYILEYTVIHIIFHTVAKKSTLSTTHDDTVVVSVDNNPAYASTVMGEHQPTTNTSTIPTATNPAYEQVTAVKTPQYEDVTDLRDTVLWFFKVYTNMTQ